MQQACCAFEGGAGEEKAPQRNSLQGLIFTQSGRPVVEISSEGLLSLDDTDT